MRTPIIAQFASAILLTGPAVAVPDFTREIRPILADKCFACHGPDANTREAKLRLDTPEGAKKEHGGARAIVPRYPEDSEAWIRIISEDPDEVMPPPDSHTELSPAEKDLLKQWILEGAPYQKHWAFIAPKKPAIPDEEKSAIDFLLQRRLAS
ncbi:MAG: hypothetical protein MK312_06335, partial [Roseibacillus sp.]|nr:hypothetical protein [Roseibacillus sp.]